MTHDEDPESGLFTPEEEALLARVRDSQLWQTIRCGMAEEREALLSPGDRPMTQAEITERWGRVRELTRWLRRGPQLVVFYDRQRRQEKHNG